MNTITKLYDSQYDVLLRLCQTIRLPLLALNLQFEIETTNTESEAFFHQDKDSLIQQDVFKLFAHPRNAIEKNPASLIESLNHPKTIQQELKPIAWHLWQRLSEEGLHTGFVLIGYSNHSSLEAKLLFDYLPINLYAKDINGVYLHSNQHYCEISGLDYHTLMGKTEPSMPWGDEADKLRENDNLVLTSNSTRMFEEPIKIAGNKTAHLLSLKTPIVNAEKQAIGLIGLSIDMLALKQTAVIEEIRKNLLQYTCQLHDNQQIEGYLQLTKRQKECFNLLAAGLSAKEIGETLRISPRTVEGHINTVKDKLGYHKQFQLGYLFGKYSDVLLKDV